MSIKEFPLFVVSLALFYCFYVQLNRICLIFSGAFNVSNKQYPVSDLLLTFPILSTVYCRVKYMLDRLRRILQSFALTMLTMRIVCPLFSISFWLLYIFFFFYHFTVILNDFMAILAITATKPFFVCFNKVSLELFKYI